MSSKRLCCLALGVALALVARVRPALAHGDIVVPQVADGPAGDGTLFKTKFDIPNLSQVERITSVKVLFFRQDGTPWSIATSQGTASEFTLNLGRLQTIRIQTSGSSTTLTSGYAIVRNTEITSVYSEDFEVGVSVFYEITRGTTVIDTVSVPTSQPTVWFAVPVEADVARNLLSGLAIVNLDTSSSNRIDLRLWNATTPTSSDPMDFGTVSFTLNAKEQRARFLTESGLYSTRTIFKGLLVGIAERPVAVLALLQTPTTGGVQYATLVATNKDALRTSTFMYLRQGFALDADVPQSDYFGNVDEDLFWDVLFETISTTSRRLTPQSGATIASIGALTDDQFDNVTLSDLQAGKITLTSSTITFTFGTSAISLDNSSANLAVGYAFAIKTGLGRYVKVHVGDVITRGSDTTKRDLALEIYVYR
jgi:hypothetical protein